MQHSTGSHTPVVMIAGASSGIGAALARHWAQRYSARCILLARRPEELRAVADSVRSLGGEATIATGDVCRPDDLNAAVALATSTYGRLDVVVANAGWSVYGAFADLTTEDYRRQFSVNVFGVLDTIRAALPELKKAKGRIVIIGSVSGHVCLPGRSAYAMSKFAVRALATSLDVELAASGVSVTLATPAYVATATRKVDRMGKLDAAAEDPVPKHLLMDPDVAARKIVRAVQARRREVVLTWYGKLLVALERLLPGVISIGLKLSGFKEKKAQ